MRIALACLACLTSAPFLTDAASAAEFPYEAVVVAEGVTAHAGADFYATATLPRGSRVTVVRHDPGGWVMIRPTAGAFSLLPAGNVRTSADGTGEVVAAGAAAEEVYPRVGSRVSGEHSVEQMPVLVGDRVRILGEVSLPGPAGPRRWVKIAPPRGDHRWVGGRYLVPVDESLRQARDADPYAVPSDAADPDALAASASAGAPPKFDAALEMALAVGRTADASGDVTPVGGWESPADGPTLAAPSLFGGTPSFDADAVAGGSSPGTGPTSEIAVPAAIAADRKRLAELDGQLDALLDAEPVGWDLDGLADDFRDLRDRGTSKAVARLADARLLRVAAMREVRAKYIEYLDLTEGTDRRDQLLAAEATKVLAPDTFDASRMATGPVPIGRTATGPYEPAATYDTAGREIIGPSLPPVTVAPMSHTEPAAPSDERNAPQFTGPAGGPPVSPEPAGVRQAGGRSPANGAPAGAKKFTAAGVVRAVRTPGNPSAPAFAVVGRDGRVIAYLADRPGIGLSRFVGTPMGVDGRRFGHPGLAKPVIAVERLTPVRLSP